MAVVNLITALEEHFGIIVDDDEISASTFETLGTLAAFVAAKAGRMNPGRRLPAPSRSSSTAEPGQRFCLFHPPAAGRMPRRGAVRPSVCR